MRSLSGMLGALAVWAAVGGHAAPAQAQGYVYVAQSYYVTPPLYPVAPLYAPPVVMLRPAAARVYVPQQPVAVMSPIMQVGCVEPVAVPTGRVIETYRNGPLTSRYQARYQTPGEPDYLYRAKRFGNQVRVREGWAY